MGRLAGNEMANPFEPMLVISLSTRVMFLSPRQVSKSDSTVVGLNPEYPGRTKQSQLNRDRKREATCGDNPLEIDTIAIRKFTSLFFNYHEVEILESSTFNLDRLFFQGIPNIARFRARTLPSQR